MGATATIDPQRFPPLNLPSAHLALRQEGTSWRVYDPVRRRYVRLTPEEWVRQHVLHALCCGKHYPTELMAVEATIEVDGLTKRCDIVVYAKSATGLLRPAMIVECKKPTVPIGQATADQAFRYNRTLRVPYLYLTNGMQHLCLGCDPQSGAPTMLAQLPTWEQLAEAASLL